MNLAKLALGVGLVVAAGWAWLWTAKQMDSITGKTIVFESDDRKQDFGTVSVDSLVKGHSSASKKNFPLKRVVAIVTPSSPFHVTLQFGIAAIGGAAFIYAFGLIWSAIYTLSSRTYKRRAKALVLLRDFF